MTPAQLSAMTDEDRTTYFEKLCLIHYGTEHPNAQIARDFSLSTMTPYQWWKKRDVPHAYVMVLYGWIFGDQGKAAELAQLSEAIAQLSVASKALSAVLMALAPLARRAALSDGLENSDD